MAKNESKTLPKRLLPSIRDFIDAGGDALLVDTGSTDGTPEIAAAGGMKVHMEGPRFQIEIEKDVAAQMNDRFRASADENIVNAGDRFFDFSSARNFAADCAEHAHCLVAGCDEAFTTLDIPALDKLCDGSVQAEAFYVHDHAEDGLARTHFHRIVLYNRLQAAWTGVVHEVVNSASSIIRIPEHVLRIDHWQEPHAHRSSYLTGLAWDCFHNPDKDRQSHYFARELFYAGRHRSAIREFERHIAMPHAWKVEQAQSRIFIGDCLLALGDEPGALAAWHRAFDMYGGRREPLMRLANHYYHKADHQRTAAYASAALTIPLEPCYCNNLDNYRHVPHELLYWALWYLGDRAGAKTHWEECLAYLPKNPKFLAEAALFA